jgi:hypothetical protein
MTQKISRHHLIPVFFLLLSACGKNIPPATITPSQIAPAVKTTPPSIAATFTATPSPTLAVTPTDPPILPLSSTVYSLAVPGAYINHLALDDHTLYWTTSGGGGLFRRFVASPKNTPGTIIAQTYFNQGTLSAYPGPSLFRAGNWLVFDDRQFFNNSSAWVLRAVNIASGAEQRIAQSQGSEILYSFSSDGEWAVWISGARFGGTAVNAQSLQTKDHRELVDSDYVQNGWEQVAVSASQAAAVYRSSAGRSLYLFDFESRQSRKLLTIATDSTMDGLSFDGNWIAWKMGTNFQGSTAVYNLPTGEVKLFPDWGYQTLLSGGWLTWEAAYEQPLYAIDLESGKGYLIAEAQPGDDLISPAIHGSVIAWCRFHVDPADRSKGDSTVQWRALSN